MNAGDHVTSFTASLVQRTVQLLDNTHDATGYVSDLNVNLTFAAPHRNFLAVSKPELR